MPKEKIRCSVRSSAIEVHVMFGMRRWMWQIANTYLQRLVCEVAVEHRKVDVPKEKIRCTEVSAIHTLPPSSTAEVAINVNWEGFGKVFRALEFQSERYAGNHSCQLVAGSGCTS